MHKYLMFRKSQSVSTIIQYIGQSTELLESELSVSKLNVENAEIAVD